MLEALPWIVSTCAVLGVLYMIISERCRRRPAGTASRAARRRGTAAQTRREVQKATRANLDRIAGALESDNAEELLAEEVNRSKDRRQ